VGGRSGESPQLVWRCRPDRRYDGA